ncbi:MAG: hypothetical protein ACOYOS_15810 [Syntrophales bacterium]
MNEDNPTAAEMLQIMREECPGIEVRSLKQGDPELSSVAISFYPYPMPLKLNEDTPPKKVRRKITRKAKLPD